MTLNKRCTTSKAVLTTKNTVNIGRKVWLNKDMLFVNCKCCGSTFVIARKIEAK